MNDTITTKPQSPLPNIGDKVIPLADLEGEWHYLDEWYRDKVGTVTSFRPDNSGRQIITAEFQSRMKPDDTIAWDFYEWKPADGHTLTVSQYRPTVGDKVTITGYLSNEGIIDTIAHDGYIRAVDGDIWTIDSPLYGRQVSGPGYIALVLAASDDTSGDAPALVSVEKVEELEHQLARANERVEEFRRRESLMRSDWTAYTTRIMEEANERDWCGEYDRIMEEIQGSLNILVIPEREQDVDIEWEETYTVTVKRSGTARLHSGYDSDDIEEAARSLNGDSDATQEEILRAVRDGEYESDSYVDGSAEEA